MSNAYQVPGFKPGTFTAGADLSGHQFKSVKLNAAGNVVLCGDGELSLGILQNKPISGEACEIDMSGISKAIMGGIVANAGTKLASDLNGKLIAAVATKHVVAILLAPSAVDGDVLSVKVIGTSGQLL